jgi:Cu-Zn family superoxide dismutase
MKTKAGAWLAAAVLVGSGFLHAETLPKSVSVSMETSDARDAGRVILIAAKGGIKVSVHLQNLNPGKHGISFFQDPSCNAPSFRTAGSAFPTFAKRYGMKHPIDLAVGDDGMAKQTLFVKGLSLNPHAANSVFANGGSSVILYKGGSPGTGAAADDREACGIVSLNNASLGKMHFKTTRAAVSSSNH